METVITGVASLIPSGEMVANLKENGVKEKTSFPTEEVGGKEYPIGRVSDDYLSEISPKERRRMDRISAFSCVVAQRLMKDSGLVVSGENSNRIGSIYATFNGTITTNAKIHREIIQGGLPNISPMWFPSTVYNAPLGAYTRMLSIKGVSSTMAGSDPIFYAKMLLETGRADAILIVTTDEINDLFVSSYGELGLLRDKNDALQLYSEEKGFVYSESFSGIVLETLESAQKRDAKIYGKLKHCATGTDNGSSIEFHNKFKFASEELVSSVLKKILKNCSTDQEIIVMGAGNGTGLDQAEKSAMEELASEYSGLKLVSTKTISGETFCPGFINNIISGLVLKEKEIAGLTNYLNGEDLSDYRTASGGETLIMANQYLPNGIFSSAIVQ